MCLNFFLPSSLSIEAERLLSSAWLLWWWDCSDTTSSCQRSWQGLANLVTLAATQSSDETVIICRHFCITGASVTRSRIEIQSSKRRQRTSRRKSQKRKAAMKEIKERKQPPAALRWRVLVARAGWAGLDSRTMPEVRRKALGWVWNVALDGCYGKSC